MRELQLSALLGEQHPLASFHDAIVHTIHLDYETRVVEMACTLWVDEGETTAEGTLSFSGLLYCVIEPPDSSYAFEDGGLDLSSDGSLATTEITWPLPKLPDIPAEAFVHWFFATNWNAFVYIAATDAEFVWK